MPGFVLLVRDRGDGDPAMRIGITVTKKIGGAVVRNRMKRRFRSLAREVLPEAGVPGADHVLIGRAGGIERPYAQLGVELQKALRKLTPAARPELVEACPERLPQAGSRRGLPFSSAPSSKKDRASTAPDAVRGRAVEGERPRTIEGERQ